MTQHKENILSQPAKPAAFCCTFLLHKKKIKKVKKNEKESQKSQKFGILKEEQKKGTKKEPKRNRTERKRGGLENTIIRKK